MIISRAPLRISLAGGITDIPQFYENNEFGAVTSMAIDKYVHIFINEHFDKKVRVAYRKFENVDTSDKVSHPIVRECLKKFNIDNNIEITTSADIPGGTGLGSSSAFTVCLINSLAKFCGKTLNKKEIAEMACDIEINVLKENIGKQDQYASAFGGVNYIKFTKYNVDVEPLYISQYTSEDLTNNLHLMYLNRSSNASDILKKQIVQFNDKNKELLNLRDIAKQIRDILYYEKPIEDIGKLMDTTWSLKKQMDGVTNNDIESTYENAISNGALGGKVCGAGGRGFLLLYVPCDNYRNVYNKVNLRKVPFRMDTEGVKTLYES